MGKFGKEIPIEHITNYGNTNAEEAFAEAFKLYIVKGLVRSESGLVGSFVKLSEQVEQI